MRWFVLILGALLVACPSGNDGGQDGGGDASVDAGDGGTSDGATDGGIDCSNVGCGAPPVCRTACDAPCGCCSCGSGEAYCQAGGDGGTSALVTCDDSQGCYDVAPCTADGGMCIDPANESPLCSSCTEVRTDYITATDQARGCQSASECQILDGHCGIGLGGCYYYANVSLTQATLDRLADRFSALGCFGAVCACAAPSRTVDCVGGICVGQ